MAGSHRMGAGAGPFEARAKAERHESMRSAEKQRWWQGPPQSAGGALQAGVSEEVSQGQWLEGGTAGRRQQTRQAFLRAVQ